LMMSPAMSAVMRKLPIDRFPLLEFNIVHILTISVVSKDVNIWTMNPCVTLKVTNPPLTTKGWAL
jgi:hypothetical protein